MVSAAEDSDGWLLEVADGGIGWLRLPDGGRVEVVLPDADPQVLDGELTRLDDLANGTSVGHPASGDDAPVPEPEPDPSANGQPTGVVVSDRAIEPPWCEVRLLGEVEVVCGGTRVEELRRRSLEVLAYLALHHGHVSEDKLVDAVWAGQAADPGSQRVRSATTKLRAALGDGPDGQPLVGLRSPGERHLRLSPHLGCDIHRAFAHLDRAEQLPDDQGGVRPRRRPQRPTAASVDRT